MLPPNSLSRISDRQTMPSYPTALIPGLRHVQVIPNEYVVLMTQVRDRQLV